MKTLIIDNYDSFTYNLYQYVGEIHGNPEVFYNDQITLDQIKQNNYTHIIISPGPGHPKNDKDIGVCKDIILNALSSLPLSSPFPLPPSPLLLGVCLGHQAIVHLMGGSVIHAPSIMHGKTSHICHDDSQLFRDIPEKFEVMRYHSFMADKKDFPKDLHITSKTDDDNTSRQVIMSFEHKHLPLFGVQFHPESVGSLYGKQILKNFLAL